MVGREVSDTERRIFGLPYRFGGLAIRNPVLTADEEYQASSSITSELTRLIINQIDDVQSVNEIAVRVAKENFRKSKEENLKKSFDNICKLLPEEQRRYLHSATEKGASSWFLG